MSLFGSVVLFLLLFAFVAKLNKGTLDLGTIITALYVFLTLVD